MEAVKLQKSIKGYELKEKLGTGGFGAVYRAYQSTVGREVAVKVILPTLANQSEFIRRFEGEAQVVARLEHPHITPLYDYWRDPDGAYLVMRWLKGGSLRDALDKGKFELRAAALLLDQIAGALSLAHRNGIIHRDIKPANILLDEDGNAYLTDFGIAKDLSIASSGTQPDMIVGSLDYISPEQARSEAVSSRTDIYSLGVTLYEMIVGEHPFRNVSPIERLYKHINDPLPDISGLENAAELNRVIQKATAKNPEQRYPDALAFAADFREAIGLNRSSPSVVELLTQREQEILQCIIEGLSNKEIAQKLTITHGTVKWYVNQIYEKLGVRSRVQAMVRARELNLIVKGSEQPVHVATEDFQAENPYKGLRAFQAADYQDFFGREKISAKLLKRMEEKAEFGRFLAVVGPSGSGKSSLVKAGLIPALWRGALAGSEKWFVVEMTPATRPMDELEIALTKLAANQAANLHEHLQRDNHGLLRAANLILPNDSSELLLVIDQFEEVFTLSDDEVARQQFLDLLYAAVTNVKSRVRVLITLRADFYDRPLHYAAFGEMLKSRLETILPLSAEELERAISKPAERVGLVFEAGLVASMVADLNYQAGALPLLQYALTELFEQRKGRLLNREAYEKMGKSTGALAKRADEIYSTFDEAGQAAAKQVFLRLVTVTEGAEDTRRRASRAELLTLGDSELIEEVLDSYSNYRLLTLDNHPVSREPIVEVAHEAILREWERLHDWLNESREDIRIQRQVAAMAQEWLAAKQDKSFLARGSRLESFEQWAETSAIVLTPLEQSFIKRSIEGRAIEAEKEAEQEARENVLKRRSVRTLRLLVGVLALASLLSGGLAVFAFKQEAESNANFSRAERQRLALLANDAMDNGASGNVGFALAMRSLDYGYSAEADEAVLRASTQGLISNELLGHQFEVDSVSYSHDGRLIATGSEGGIRIYDSMTGEEVQFIDTIDSFAIGYFSPRDDLIVVQSSNSPDKLYLYDGITGEEIAVFEHEGKEVNNWYFSVNGENLVILTQDLIYVWNLENQSLLASYPTVIDGQHTLYTVETDGDIVRFHIIGEDGVISFQDARTSEEICQLESMSIQSIYKYEMDYQYWIGIGLDNQIYVWDIVNCKLVATFEGHNVAVIDIAVNFETRQVITADVSRKIILWNMETGEEIERYFSDYAINSLAIAPNGQSFATGVFGKVSVWQIGFPVQPRIVQSSIGASYFTHFSPDGQSLYLGGFGSGYERIALSDENALTLQSYNQYSIRTSALSPDGQFLAVALEDNVVNYLLGVETSTVVQEFEGQTEIANFIDFSPDGSLVAYASFDLVGRIWDVASGELRQTLTGHEGLVSGIDFAPNGQTILTTSSDGTARIWDVASGEILKILDHQGAPLPYGEFSPNGQLVATSDVNGFAYIWDVETGQELHRLVGHTNFVQPTRFSPDGSILATASQDGTVRLWDVTSGELLRILTVKNSEQLFFAEFSPDGNYIVAGGESANAYIWRVDLDSVIAEFCNRNFLDLSDAQRQQYGILDNEATCPNN